MKNLFLPLPLRALATTAACALLTASTLAQAPAPAAPGTAPAATPAPKPLGVSEKNFIKNVGKSTYFLVQVSSAAKAVFNDPKDPLVKLRDTTIKDMNKTWEALNKIATVRGEKMTGELVGADKSDIERLGKLKDDKFAKLWLETLVKEAKKLDKDFESAARSLQDVEFKTFVANYTPAVRGVLTSSEAAEKNLKKK